MSEYNDIVQYDSSYSALKYDIIANDVLYVNGNDVIQWYHDIIGGGNKLINKLTDWLLTDPID